MSGFSHKNMNTETICFITYVIIFTYANIKYCCLIAAICISVEDVKSKGWEIICKRWTLGIGYNNCEVSCHVHLIFKKNVHTLIEIYQAFFRNNTMKFIIFSFI